MRVAIIDAEIIRKRKHRFPNLACMKISAYYKTQGAVVELKSDYNGLDAYEKVYESQYKDFYSVVASWCNQPALFKTFTFRLFAICRGMSKKGYNKYKRDVAGYLTEFQSKGVSWRSMLEIEEKYPEIAKEYYDMEYK